MLSLIICSRTPRISEELEKNIAETIGCDYELVVIDNSKNKYSIFSAYNEGVRRSKGDILCFMHDDILYKTTGWGTKVEKMLEDESIGIVGVIGSYVMTKDYGYWDMMAPWVTGRVPCGVDGNYINDCDFYYDIHSSSEVVAIDGMWFCSRKDLFGEVTFDEQTYKWFHFYDMDICMQSLIAGYKNVVIREVEIWHNCHPRYDSRFIDSMKCFYKKWEKQLPIFRGEALKITDKEYNIIKQTVKNYYSLLGSYTEIRESTSYKIGNYIVMPYRKMVKLFKRCFFPFK